MTTQELSLAISDFMEFSLVKRVNFDDNELEVLKKHIKVTEYKKKEKILNIGDKETSFRFVRQGLVRQFYVFNNKEINVQFAGRQDIVCSYFSYMSHEASEYCIEALEPTYIYTFSREDMDKMMIQGLKFIEFGKGITAYMCKQKATREKSLLNYDAFGRLQHFMNLQSDLFLRLPQIYIASYLNIQPETFSTLKRRLK